MHKYYAELLTGERKPITEWAYMMLTKAHGWRQIIAIPGITIIRRR